MCSVYTLWIKNSELNLSWSVWQINLNKKSWLKRGINFVITVTANNITMQLILCRKNSLVLFVFVFLNATKAFASSHTHYIPNVKTLVMYSLIANAKLLYFLFYLIFVCKTWTLACLLSPNTLLCCATEMSFSFPHCVRILSITSLTFYFPLFWPNIIFFSLSQCVMLLLALPLFTFEFALQTREYWFSKYFSTHYVCVCCCANYLASSLNINAHAYIKW